MTVSRETLAGGKKISGRFKSFALLLVLLPLSLVIVGCRAVAGPEGWAGPASSDSLLIASIDHNRLVALDLTADNEEVWRFPPENVKDAPELLGLYGTAAVATQMVFVGDYNDVLYALDLADGRTVWALETGGPIVGGPAVEGDTVYVGSSDGCLYALAVDDGSERWKPFCTGDKVWSTPTVSGGVVYFGSMDKKLYALDAATGQLRWEFEADASITSTPVVDGGRVYVGALNSKFYALDASSGEMVWSFDSSDWFWNRAALGEDAVFVGNLGGDVYALDRDDGKLLWDGPFRADGGVRAAPALSGGTLVVADENGGIYGINAATGEERWSKDAGSGVLSDLLLRDGTVYLSTKDGALLAVSPDNGDISTIIGTGAG
ncbi:MAG: PQQ-binding-like beta-propeller repeat protein [Dehalococcoidia bacterium]|nr:PQQ-binding-like beta-propeller repeat protein [Dehalococcoidia bacterium]